MINFNTPLHRRWTSLIFLSAFLLFGMSLFYSCKKEESSILKTQDTKPLLDNIESRSDSNDLNWLIDFQNYLQQIYNSEEPAEVYSNEEFVYGLERLFNYKFSESEKGITVSSSKQIYDISEISNRLTIYNSIEQFIEHDFSSRIGYNFGFVNISFETENAISIQVHYNYSSECILDHYTHETSNSPDCDSGPFTNEEYFIGLGGEDGEDHHFPCEPDLDVCGGAANCEVPDNYAMEEIENFIDLDLQSNFHCPRGQVAYLYDIETVALTVESFNSVANNCYPENYNVPNLGPCTCMDADLLNCFYCSTVEFLNQDFAEEFSFVDDDHVIVDVDLIVNWVG